MNIAATAVSMDAARTYKEVEQHIAGVQIGQGTADRQGRADLFGASLASMLASITSTTLSCQSEVNRAGTTSHLPQDACAAAEASPLAQLATEIIGQPVAITATENGAPSLASNPPTHPLSMPVTARTSLLTSGTVYSQEESLLFSVQGSVQTADGRDIDFSLGLAMERQTVAAEMMSLNVTQLFIDPLVLQFDVDSPLLAESTFLFDLDGNGTREALACPGSGCGFLAFDRNRDGCINSGLELFGPQSGSGFGELAVLDSDANAWIDENDPVFDQLSIWRPDGQGGESLVSLREAGVGAIAVFHAGTGFQLERADGSIMGEITASGIFLTEAGEVRSLQEIDLALPDNQRNPIVDGEERADQPLLAALGALRDIISMQRLRLQLILGGERLRSIVAKRAERQELMFEWLHVREEWQTRIAYRFDESGMESSGVDEPASGAEPDQESTNPVRGASV
jgi:hypothetical protein